MVTIKHAKTSNVPDRSNSGLVRPSDWNANHTINQQSGFILGRVSMGEGSTEELAPEQVRALINVIPVVKLTEEAYQSLPEKDPNTLYVTYVETET